MPGKTKTSWNWLMPTSDFNDLWAAALTQPADKQWSFMIRACWETFSKSENNQKHLGAWKKDWKTQSDEVCHEYITGKIYSKCSNIRSTMGSVLNQKPPFPSGRSKKSIVKVDWSAEANKFPTMEQVAAKDTD